MARSASASRWGRVPPRRATPAYPPPSGLAPPPLARCATPLRSLPFTRPALARTQAAPTFSLFSTAEGGAAYVARDLLELSSHFFKPDVQRRLRRCLEASLPLAALPAAAAEAGRAVEEAAQDEAVAVSGRGWQWWRGGLGGLADGWQEGQGGQRGAPGFASWAGSLHSVPGPASTAVSWVPPADASPPPRAAPLPQRLPKSSWRDVRYKGDPMLRPIASYEIGLLVRLLVALSVRLNAALGLDSWQRRGAGGEEEPPEDRVQEVLARARRRGLRVNLRPLADVRNLAWIPIGWFLVLHTLRFLTWLVLALATGPGEGAGGGYAAQQRQYRQHGGGQQQHHQRH